MALMAHHVLLPLSILSLALPSTLACDGFFYNVTLEGSYGLGWDVGWTLTAYSCDGDSLFDQSMSDGYVEHGSFCVPDYGVPDRTNGAFTYSHQCTITGSCDYASEISWSIFNSNGTEVATGAAGDDTATYGDCGTSAPTTAPTPCPATVTEVLLLADTNYIDTDTSVNMADALDSLLCITVTSDLDWVAGGLTAQLSDKDVFVIPEIALADWSATLTTADQTALYDFVSDGGSLILGSDKQDTAYDAALLASVFNMSITHPSNAECFYDGPDTMTLTSTWDYRTVFASRAPATLTRLLMTWCLEIESLPQDAVSVYGNENVSWVTWIPVKSGSINLIAFDYKAVTDTSSVSDWTRVIELSMYSQQTDAPSIVPSPSPTILPTHSRPPSSSPTSLPIPAPSPKPTGTPSHPPSPLPTLRPSPRPSGTPTPIPFPQPTAVPIPEPTSTPTPVPTMPTFVPTPIPTHPPSLTPTPIDRVTTKVSMDISVTNENDISEAVVVDTLASILSDLDVTSSNIMDFEYTSWTAARRRLIEAGSLPSTDSRQHRLLSGVASVTASVVVDLSDTVYTSAASLETAIETTISDAETDGTLETTLNTECGCAVASVEVSVALARGYPTYSPTPIPTPLPTACDTQPYTFLKPQGGDTYKTGDVIAIKWEPRDCTSDNVKIYICGYVSGGDLDCYGAGDVHTNADDFEPNTGMFNLTIEQDLPTGSGTLHQIKVVDNTTSLLFSLSPTFGYDVNPTPQPTHLPTSPSVAPTKQPSVKGNVSSASSDGLLIVGAGAAAAFILLAVAGTFMLRSCRQKKDNDRLMNGSMIEMGRMDASEVPETAVEVSGEWVEEGADQEAPIAVVVSEMNDEELARVAYGSSSSSYSKQEKEEATRRLSAKGLSSKSFNEKSAAMSTRQASSQASSSSLVLGDTKNYSEQMASALSKEKSPTKTRLQQRKETDQQLKLDKEAKNRERVAATKGFGAKKLPSTKPVVATKQSNDSKDDSCKHSFI